MPPLSPKPLLVGKGIHKVYEKDGERIEVLRGIDIELKKGESLSIVGASGVGKSTLLHILGTLDRPTKGTVLFEGEEIFRYNEEQLASFRNKRIGFIFQFHHLLPELTALENTMVPALIARKRREEAREMAFRILEELGLEKRIYHRAGELSGGEQQRVAVARALIMNPRILLADEPTGNLDPKTGRHIHKLLVDLNREKGITMIVVTHNPTLAGLMQRKAKIEDGYLVEL